MRHVRTVLGARNAPVLAIPGLSREGIRLIPNTPIDGARRTALSHGDSAAAQHSQAV